MGGVSGQGLFIFYNASLCQVHKVLFNGSSVSKTGFYQLLIINAVIFDNSQGTCFFAVTVMDL